MVTEILGKMISYFGQDRRRTDHTLKVYGYALTIGGKEQLCADNLLALELAAILHDIGIKESERKYNSSAGNYQEIEGPPVAKELMENEGIEKSVIDRVCYLVGNHHSYDKIDGIDFQILVEADFLVNIDEGAIDSHNIKSIKEKYFKTAAGNRILESLYNI
jgi:HD superfamily phosphodiesterase